MTTSPSDRQLTFVWDHSLARGMWRLQVTVAGGPVFDDEHETEVAAWVREGVEREAAGRQARVSTWNVQGAKGGWWYSSAGEITVIVETVPAVEALAEAVCD